MVLINPKMLVQVFTCKNGEYSPITMHGIVDEAVAFQIRTRYHCHDGSELQMMVGLGMNVSVNFIVRNAWMKRLGPFLITVPKSCGFL